MRKARAFVPKMTIRRAVVGVLPACALAAATDLAACTKNQDAPHIIALAVMAFDAGVDASSVVDTALAKDASAPLPTAEPSPPVLVLAMVAFDAGRDRPRRRQGSAIDGR